LRKDGSDMGNKMRGGKKCDFMININVAVTTARRGPSDDGIGDDVKRLRIMSMLLSLSVINGKTFLPVFACDRRESYAMLRYICGVHHWTTTSRGGVASRDVGSVEVDLQLRGHRHKTIQ